jgi:GTP-binding protein
MQKIVKLLPVPNFSVVIVGRPNVGKSTLFNAITASRRSIVGDQPGITRDRIHAPAVHLGRRFELIDTGGIIPNDAEFIPSQILKQARVAIEQAAHIIYLLDGRAEITGADRDLARMLKRLGKPVALAVNKIDSVKSENLVHGFHELGFPDVFAVSAEHRLGIGEMLDHITASFPASEEAEPSAAAPTRIKVAIIGRPNVGKSTLLNALVGQERAIVSPIPGTTRDAVDECVLREDGEFVFVDTAGIRRKGKTKLMAEKLSVVMARRHIRMAHVVLLVIDALDGVAHADAAIAGYAHEDGRALILCVNKWDAVADKNRQKFIEELRLNMKFLEYAPVVLLSARTGAGVEQLFGMVRHAYESASHRVTTGELNRFAETIDLGPDIKIRYLTQASIRPPTFVVFTNKRHELHFSTTRNLTNRLRKQFDFYATPIVVKTRARQT